MSPPRLEDRLAELDALRNEPDRVAAGAALRAAIKAKSNHLVAKAAELAVELGCRELNSELAAAFQHFMTRPTTTDKGCRAKIALAAALHDLSDDAADVFWLGIAHVQMEPVWGGQVDTAIELRSLCAMALAASADPDVLPALADLLADREPQARAGAARALTHRGGDDAAALLRLRVRVGDEPQVLVDCLAGLLQLSPRKSIPLVQALLDGPDASAAEAAVLALGQSRLEDAFDMLCAHLDRTMDAAARAAVLLGIALLRSDQSLAFLVGLVRHADEQTARQSLEASAMYRGDAALRARLAEVVGQREPAVREVFEQQFGGKDE